MEGGRSVMMRVRERSGEGAEREISRDSDDVCLDCDLLFIIYISYSYTR